MIIIPYTLFKGRYLLFSTDLAEQMGLIHINIKEKSNIATLMYTSSKNLELQCADSLSEL